MFVLAGCESRLELEEKYLEKAQMLIDQGQYTEALLELDLVMKINPKNASSRYLKALIAIKEEQYDSAQSLLRKVVYIQPGFLDAQTLLGKLYLDGDEDADLAMSQANLVLDKDGSNLKAMNLKANVLMWRREKGEAERMAKNILNLDPDNLSANQLLARIYGSDGAFEKALSLIDRLLGKYPDEIDLYLLKISNLMNTNDFIKAESTYKTLLRKFPEEQELYTKFIEFYMQSGAVDKAEQTYRQLIAQVPERTQPKLQLISFLLEHKNEELAEQELKKFINNEPDNYRFQFRLVSLYQDKPEQQVKLLSNIAEKNQYGGNGLKARNMLARQALQKGDKDKARQLVGKVLENAPINSDALLIQSILLVDEGKYSAAIRDLRTMIRDNPDSEEALMLLADTYVMTQHHNLARGTYRRILKINPENSIASNKIANLKDNN